MPDKYKKILVAVDGSEQAYKALKEAIEIGKKEKVKLFIVTAINFSPWATDTKMLELLLDDDRSYAKQSIKKAKKLIPEDIDFHSEIMNENPKAAIVRYAEEEDIDLIVMGATGKGAIERALVGSTTAYVVNHAPCNVLVVR